MSPKKEVVSLKIICLKTISTKITFLLSDDEGQNYEVVKNYLAATTFEVLQDLLRIILNLVNLDASIRFSCLQLLLRKDVRKLDTGMFPQFYYDKILKVITLRGLGLQHLNLKGVWARDFPDLLSQVVRSLKGLKTLLIPHMADDAVIEAILTLEELTVLDISGEACFTVTANTVCGTIPASCPCDDCDATDRNIDGSCNNEVNTWWGTPNGTYARLTAAKYGPGFTIAKSCSGQDLPNPRLLRTTLFPSEPVLNHDLTLLVVPTLQFLAHDISSLNLPLPADACCTYNLQSIPNKTHCGAIDIPPNDPVYCGVNATCISVVKALTNVDLGCTSGKCPDQINTVTPYLDLSNIYGNTPIKSDTLRLKSGGLLIMRQGPSDHLYLPANTDKSNCYLSSCTDELCLLAGDKKVNQNVGITIITTLWVRFHNLIAMKLAATNPCWSDDKLFKVAGSITIATHQWQIMFEVMQVLLGKKKLETSGVAPISLGFTDDYDPTIPPNPFNEHSNAAMRVTHSKIRQTLIMFDEYRTPTGDISLAESMEHTQKILETNDNFYNLVIGMTKEFMHETGLHQDFDVGNRMFLRDLKVGQDLFAIDIQRARLNGIPSYNSIREFCGYPKATSFDDFCDLIDPENVKKLKAIYTCVDDVDFYVGARMEIPADDALVGPTVQCVIIQELLRIRRSDRFFFEHKASGFDLFQLNNIRLTAKMSNFLCATQTNLKYIQPNALEQPSLLNPLVPCDTLYTVDINLWKDYTC